MLILRVISTFQFDNGQSLFCTSGNNAFFIWKTKYVANAQEAFSYQLFIVQKGSKVAKQKYIFHTEAVR